MTDAKANFDEHMDWVRFLAAVRPLRPEWRNPIEVSLQMEMGFASDTLGKEYQTKYIEMIKQEFEYYPELCAGSDIILDLGGNKIILDLEAMGPDPLVRWACIEEYLRTWKSKFIKMVN